MPKLDASINDRQREILRRIAEGKDPVTAAEPELAVSVYALRRRRLVTIARTPGHPWVARMTERGSYLLELRSGSSVE